jgi:hypothetical protein
VVTSPAWSDTQKVVGAAHSPGGHVATAHRTGWLQTIIAQAGTRPAVHPSTRFHQGIDEHKIVPLPVLPVSRPYPFVRRH